METTWRVISRVGEVETGGKSTRNKKHYWKAYNRQAEVKNSIGNGEAKELICTIHGHELKQGRQGMVQVEQGERGEKN